MGKWLNPIESNDTHTPKPKLKQKESTPQPVKPKPEPQRTQYEWFDEWFDVWVVAAVVIGGMILYVLPAVQSNILAYAPSTNGQGALESAPDEPDYDWVVPEPEAKLQNGILITTEVGGTDVEVTAESPFDCINETKANGGVLCLLTKNGEEYFTTAGDEIMLYLNFTDNRTGSSSVITYLLKT
jgi:hypothetical protein